jgi:hypothetical protein
MSLKKYCFLFFMIISVVNTMGQGQPGGGGPGGGLDAGSGEAPTGAVPFEGIGFLLAAGMSYGAKKVYDYRKKSRGNHDTESPKD